MFSKPAEVQGRAKFSFGSVFICGSSDREARKLSEARGREATIGRLREYTKRDEYESDRRHSWSTRDE